ncbi:MAG: flagellar biosynthetic protein FliR [Methylococcaceae bacterium]|nr:flagellar biosynthetic protein FliR [Methylococcaceae bacterium]
MDFTEAQLQALIASFFWPLIRISALFITLPIFSISEVPARVRMILSLAITFLVMPLIPPLPALEIFSYTGLMVTIQQLFIGLLSGFVLQMVFSAVALGGQGVSNGMGLGFAAVIDPQDGQQVPVIAQFYTVTCTLVFISMNAHLLLIEMVVDSFKSLPISAEGLGKTELWSIINWSKQLLSAGLLLSLPVMASLLFVNISFGVAARAAPQIQIFSISFPVTILVGLVLMWMTLPNALGFFSNDLLLDAYDFIGQLLRVSR